MDLDLTQAMDNLSVVTPEELMISLRNLSYGDFLTKFTMQGIISQDDPYFKGIFTDSDIMKNFIDHINKVLADNTEGKIDDDTCIKLFICLSVSFNSYSAHCDPCFAWTEVIGRFVHDYHCISEEHGNLLCSYPHRHDLPQKVIIGYAVPLSSDEAAATMATLAMGDPQQERLTIPASTIPVSTFDSSTTSPTTPSTPKRNNSKQEQNVLPPIKSSIKNGKFEVESDSYDDCKALFQTAADHDFKVTEKQEEESTKRKTEEEMTKRKTEEETTKRSVEEETTKRTETVELTKRTVAGETTKQMDLKVKALQLENEQLKLKAELKQPAIPPMPMIPPPSIPPPSASSYSQQPAAMIPSSSQQQPLPPMIPSSSRSTIPSSSRSSATEHFTTPNGEEWQTMGIQIDGSKTFPRKDRLKQHLAPVQCIGGWEMVGNVRPLLSHPLKPKAKTFNCSCKNEHKARLRIIQLPKADDGTYSYIFQRHEVDYLHSTGEPMAAPMY